MTSRPRIEHRQREHRVRLEWGQHGVEVLAAECAVVIVIDVLSFSTAVVIAVGRGASVLPLPRPDRATAAAFGATPAAARGSDRPNLRPASLLALPPGTLLALPSPNGATLCAAAGDDTVLFAGCLRNASAVAAAALEAAGEGAIGIVPAGERWPDGTLRAAGEDLVGAGAIAACLPGRSVEAELAAAQFEAAQQRGLADVLAGLSSGRELIADGFAADVELAAAHDVSTAAPRRRSGILAA